MRLGIICGLLLASAGACQADSLWRDGQSNPMFSDKRASRLGDIVTILVQETTTATKDNSTTTTKQSSVDSALAAFLYSPAASGLLTKGGTMPSLKFTGKSDFTGGGTINNSQNVVASVAVRIIDVLPNHNFVIEGTRDCSFSGEKQTVVLRGTIRPDDIQPNNTIYSYNISDATINIISKGTITDAQRKGWFHKLWDKFSPF